MAERIISPGVFTREIDQSFLPGAVAQIGPTIAAPICATAPGKLINRFYPVQSHKLEQQ